VLIGAQGQDGDAVEITELPPTPVVLPAAGERFISGPSNEQFAHQRGGVPACRQPRLNLRVERVVERRGGNPSAASAVSAIPRVIGAAGALSARRRIYGKEKVYGSIP
jgi:hypothetical protein